MSSAVFFYRRMCVFCTICQLEPSKSDWFKPLAYPQQEAKVLQRPASSWRWPKAKGGNDLPSTLALALSPTSAEPAYDHREACPVPIQGCAGPCNGARGSRQQLQAGYYVLEFFMPSCEDVPSADSHQEAALLASTQLSSFPLKCLHIPSLLAPFCRSNYSAKLNYSDSTEFKQIQPVFSTKFFPNDNPTSQKTGKQ